MFVVQFLIMTKHSFYPLGETFWWTASGHRAMTWESNWQYKPGMIPPLFTEPSRRHLPGRTTPKTYRKHLRWCRLREATGAGWLLGKSTALMPTSARTTELVSRRKDKQNKCNLALGRTSGAYDTKNKSQNWRSLCRILCKVAVLRKGVEECRYLWIFYRLFGVRCTSSDEQPVICIATSGGIILYAMGVGDHGLVSREYESG